MGPFTYFLELVISLWQSVSGPHPLLWYHWLQAYHFYVALFVLCLRFTQHRFARCTHPWWDQLLCWLSLSSAGNQVPPPLSDGQQASDEVVRAAYSLDQLHVNAKEYFRSGLADSTHRTYGAAAQRQFLSFCDNYGLAPLPASEDTLILSVTSLAARIKPQSINFYLADVRSLHVSNGYDNPLTPGLRLKQTLRGIERNHFAPPKRKMPITFDLPCKIHVFVNFRSNDDVVYWAAITWGHFLLFNKRRKVYVMQQGALWPLTQSRPRWRHFSSVPRRSALLDGAHKTVENWPTTGQGVCPACAMKSNLALQRSRPNMSEESLLFLLENNQALTKQQLVTFVSHLLRLIGVDPTAYGRHSFRIGGSTSASYAGLADYEIQMLGSWKSDCYKTYVRSPLNVLLQFPQRTSAKTASITYQYANPYYDGQTTHDS